MKKIDKLVFKNFKFFADEQIFDFNRQNILLYGENGSGKSSIYWGLYTFLQSSIKNDDEVKKYFDKDNDENLINHFIEEDDKDDAFISLELSDDNDIIEKFQISYSTINTNKATNTNIKRANSTSDFINYRLLSRFYDFRNSEEIDIWELFEKEVLDYITIDGENLKNSWSSLKDGIPKRANKYPPIHSQTYKDFQANLTSFNQIMEIFLANIVAKTNTLLLNNFKENISIKIEYNNSTYNDFVEGKKSRNHLVKRPKIILKVKFNGKELFRPHTFLNEAKLTAIALSLRFAILKTRLVSEDILKILILDDLLISLDMSHRLEVINIILNDEDLRDYQKIILTHDRAFFEMAKQKFNYREKSQWKYFEMYLDIDSEKNIEVPYIKEYGQEYGNINIAKNHFKNKDYPATANYLRKEVEGLFDKFLQIDNLNEKIKLAKLKENEQLIWDIQKDLKRLLNVLEQFGNCEQMPEAIQAQKCKEFSEQVISSIESIRKYINDDFHFEEFEDVKMILKSILHPQSHNDLTRPLYKKELEDAIALVEAFDGILHEG